MNIKRAVFLTLDNWNDGKIFSSLDLWAKATARSRFCLHDTVLRHMRTYRKIKRPIKNINKKLSIYKMGGCDE